MMIALAKLDDSQWDYIVNDLHLIKDNILDIHNDDVTGGLEAFNARYEDYDRANANIVKFLSNLNNTKSSTEELTSLGYKPEIATDEIGHLYDGINPEDTKDFKFNVTEKTTTPPTTDEDNGQTGNTGDNNTGNDNAGNNNGGTNNSENNNQTNTPSNNENNEELPDTLPKTGTTQYVYVITAVAILGTTYIAIKNIKEDKNQKR